MLKLCVVTMVLFFLGSTCGHVDIRKPPTITRHPLAIIIYRSDDSVILECKAEGIPAVQYEWKKNSLDLDPNHPNIDKGADGTITIKQAAASDEGFYQCIATNQYGTAVSNTAHIQRAVLGSASSTSTIIPKTVEEGHPFHIQADPLRSFPKPAYGWEVATDTIDKSPVQLRPSRRMQIAENGDLHFAYAKPEDDLNGRIYKCTTYNPQLDIKAGGSYRKLTVTRNPEGLNEFAPTFGFASEEQTVAVIGRNVSLRCFFYGNPEPGVAWIGPRNTLPAGRHTYNNHRTELVINNIIASDEGSYICTGSNTKGLNRTTLQIRVEAVPRFLTVENGPRDVNVTEGESFTFSCNATAKPEATVVWFQDGKQLDPGQAPKRFVFSANKKTLTIRDVCRDCHDPERQTDLMVIQCNASNVHGYAFASGYLNVLRRTAVTIYNRTDVEVYADEEGRVQLDCNATSDPSTPPTYKWYKVVAEGEEPLYNNPPFLTINAGQFSIQVAANAIDNWPKYLGQYRCVVDTGHSRVNQTQSISPKTRPDTGHSRVNQTATVSPMTKPMAMTSLFVDVDEPTSPTCTEKDYTWIWICIGVGGCINILVCVFCEVSRRKRNKRTGRSNIVKLSSKEAGTEAADPFNH